MSCSHSRFVWTMSAVPTALLRSMGICNNQHGVIWTRLGVLFESWSWKILYTFEHSHIALCAIWVFRIWTYTRPIELISNSTVYRWEYRLSAMYVTLYGILFSCVISLASGHTTENWIRNRLSTVRQSEGLQANDKEKVIRTQTQHYKQQNNFRMELEKKKNNNNKKKCSSIVLFAILFKT